MIYFLKNLDQTFPILKQSQNPIPEIFSYYFKRYQQVRIDKLQNKIGFGFACRPEVSCSTCTTFFHVSVSFINKVKSCASPTIS